MQWEMPEMKRANHHGYPLVQFLPSTARPERLHGELPLSLEELEKVFDTLDADGNGSLTPEEFTSGFSQFLFGQNISVSEMQGYGTENMYQSKWTGNCEDSNEEEDEDHQFSNLMEKLGANKVLEE
ncbi:UNVERIFIED_CONTAM: hypothetical protein K2H54_000688 [Gekko kuhli]